MIEQLIKIQNELKAPKNQFNSFGKYKYRSCEDILEAVKPICFKYGLLLTVTDQLIEIGGQLFVEAIASISDGTNAVNARAQAGLDLNKKGMDKAQATGTSSSYARKYALNGLFLIDDTKDADATNTHGKTITTDKAELKADSQAYVNVVTALKSGKFSIGDVEKKYKLSPEVKNKLTTL